MELSGSASIVVDVAPDDLWALLADPLRMPEWSPECRRVSWLSGGPPAAVGAQFQGHNRLPFVGTWRSTSTIVACEPPERLAWHVGSDPQRPNTIWAYDIADLGDGRCRVTERYEMRREPLVVLMYYRLVGRRRRLQEGMEQTLRRLKAAAEQSG
ncbi:MAG TPA: SRPBCC family protein [Acidimicrobiia bacterium]|jgi:uncharacterized protein YndB with AHSA1/START domain